MKILYRFTMDSGQTEAFFLRFKAESMEAETELPAVLPDWSLLDFCKCGHCPFSSDTVMHCPLVVRLVDVINRLGSLVSYDAMLVEVESPERSISVRTSAQRGVCSMLGLIIPTSGCPYADYFRPMARFHLPFATPEETFYRAASMYMLSQYFTCSEGETVDLAMEGLKKIYRNMEIVNLQLVERLREASRVTSKADSSVNAVVILDLFAKSMPFVLEDKLGDYRCLFQSYTKY